MAQRPPGDGEPPVAPPTAVEASGPTAVETSGPTAVDLRDYVVFDLEHPVGQRVFATDVVAVDLVCLEPGQEVAARVYRTGDVVYTVLGGRAWLVTDDAQVTLDPLQAVMIPAGSPHGLRNEAPDPLILHVVVSPPEDPSA